MASMWDFVYEAAWGGCAGLFEPPFPENAPHKDASPDKFAGGSEARLQEGHCLRGAEVSL